jgi:hypothetical protein
MQWSWCALAALVMSGCFGAGAPHQDPADVAREVAGLTFPVLLVHTTPIEAEGTRNDIFVAWSASAFAIASGAEPDLARKNLVSDGQAYQTFSGMGWMKTDAAAGIGAGQVSNRLMLWDLRAIFTDTRLALTRAAAGADVQYKATGTLQAGSKTLHLDAVLVASQGRVTSATVASPEGRESPFSFQATDQPLGFDATVPPLWRERADVQARDAQAKDRHTTILQLVASYARTHAGTLPQDLTPESLRVELTAANQQWPVGAYDDAAMHEAATSGQFHWTRCTLQDGLYQGHGWDSDVLRYAFGKGCTA